MSATLIPGPEWVAELREAVVVLIERRNWLTERIKAKTVVGWDIEWDTRERDALSKVIGSMEMRLPEAS